MLGKRKTFEGIDSVIGRGCNLKGDAVFADNSRVDGCINGSINSKALVIIGDKGKVIGNIKAKGLQVAGSLVGNICVNGGVELLKGCKVKGDIEAHSLLIDEKAEFQGQCRLNSDGKMNEEVIVEEDSLIIATTEEADDDNTDEGSGITERTENS